MNVAQGQVQPIWCGVQVPVAARAGTYHGRLEVSAAGRPVVPVALTITVAPDTIRDGGADEPWRLARLTWLDSRLDEDHGIVPPYTPVSRRGDTLGVLGRQMALGADGLPTAIRSFFPMEMTSIGSVPRDLLAGPLRLVAEDADGRELVWRSTGLRVVEHDTGMIVWQSEGETGPLRMAVREASSSTGRRVRGGARRGSAVSLRDIRLEIRSAPTRFGSDGARTEGGPAARLAGLEMGRPSRTRTAPGSAT